MNLPFFSTLSHYGHRFKNGKKVLAITLLRSTAEGLLDRDRTIHGIGPRINTENAYEKHAQRAGTPGGSTKTGRFIP